MAKTLSLFRPSSISIHSGIKFASLKVRAAGSVHYPLASKIIVRNLPYSANERCLQAEFSKYGQIAEVRLAKHEDSKKSKGYAFIQYTSQEDAMLALENTDHQYFDGRLLYVEIAKLRENDFGGPPKATGPPQEQSSETDGGPPKVTGPPHEAEGLSINISTASLG